MLEVEALAGEGVGTRACSDGVYTMVIVDPPTVPQAVIPRDAVFLIDISGSMEGTKLEAAKQALSAALHGLVSGDPLPADRLRRPRGSRQCRLRRV